jgi:hypothetical protein
MVFLGSSCRETAKNAIKKIEGKRRQEKRFFLNFFGQKFLDFLQKVLHGVFELPLLRNAQKRYNKNLKNKKEEEGTVVPDLVAICQIICRFHVFS